MDSISGLRITGRLHRAAGELIEDTSIRDSRFEKCVFAATLDVASRVTVRRATVSNCRVSDVQIGPVVLEEVLVEDLKGTGAVFVRGASMRHVTFRGAMPDMAIDAKVAPGSASESQERAFARANAEFYAGVDWAIDISEAELFAIRIRGVPPDLVRRDPDSQVIVRREKLLDGAWRSLPLDRLLLHELGLLVNSGRAGQVFVAPKRGTRFKEQLRDLMLLRDHGIADPT